MSTSLSNDESYPSPMEGFKKRLRVFANQRRRGIRNPFVIVPVDPPMERQVTQHLREWADSPDEPVPIEPLDLERLMVETEVFDTAASVSRQRWQQIAGKADGVNGDYVDSVTRTMQDNLTQELVDEIVHRHPALRESHERILLLLNLGSLHPFARASALLDELDRQRVRATVGIPFPGRIYAGKLAFFGRNARHYYPAHRIDRQINEDAHLK